MELKDVAVISGKPGLFKILKPTRTGVIVESIDDKKSRFVINASAKVSVLEEISLYTTTGDGSTPLRDVFQKIYKEFKDDPGVTSSSSSDELKSFIEYVSPDYDKEKVYVSDIKKIVSWYHIIYNNFPEILTQPDKKEEKAEAPKEEAGKEKKPQQKARPKTAAPTVKAKPQKAKTTGSVKRSPQSKSK